MQLTLDQIKLLASTGQALHITISSSGGPKPEVHIQGRGSFQAPVPCDSGFMEREFTRALRYYPDPATVNGVPVERYNFPGLAKVTWETYPDKNTISAETGNLQLNPCTPPVEQPFNLFAGGVLCQLHIPHLAPTVCYTPSTGAHHPHWQQADTLTLKAIPVITPEQLAAMERHDWLDLNDPHKTSPLKNQLFNEAEAQITRTLEHPGMPPLHRGPVYTYLLADAPAPAYFSNGAPIIVHRTPVILHGNNLPPRPAVVSAAETLYTTDQELVPVASTITREHRTVPKTLQTGPDLTTLPHETITGVEFSTQPYEVFSSPPPIRKLDAITMEATLKDTEAILSLPAPFWLLGETKHDRLVLHTDPGLTTHALTDAILRAYWEDGHFASKEDEEWELEQAEYNAMFLAQAVLEDPDQAYADHLKHYIETFPSDIPFPKRPITFKAASGTVTVFIKPAKTGKT